MTTQARFFSVLSAIFVGLTALTMPASLLRAAPEPSPVPTAWEFTFEPGPLRLIWIDSDQGSSPYFYFTFKVTNYWGNDLLFAPSVELVTSESEVLISNRDVPLSVTAEILGQLRNPLMNAQTDLVGTVLNGPEHAREGVLIWPATDLDVDSLTIFFAGLSGESESYVVGRDSDDPKRYSLRKSMMLRYETPGDFARQGSRPFEQVEKRWIMR